MRGLMQFTLDLFDPPGPPSAVPAKPAAPDGAPAAAQAPFSAPAFAPTSADERVSRDGARDDALPPAALPDLLQPAQFVHPRASRELLIGHARVAYEFTRGKRRTIGFVVGAEGLSVRAPRWVALRDVDAAVREKGDWILRKLAETRQRHERLESTRIDWKDGAGLLFLGREVRLRLDPGHRFEGAGAALDATGSEPLLRLAVAQNASTTQIRDAAQAWLMRQARRIFIERLDHFAPKLGVAWKKLSLSNATTRWGSASADGAIRLHWRLVHFRMPVIDYVVAHELSHLRVMDHSPRFWETVESVIPDYDRLRRQLKEEAVPRW